MLRVEKLSKNLGSFRIDDVSFEIPNGSYSMILGQSGAGKSVLINLICGFINADNGMVLWNGEPLSKKSVGKPLFSIVFQNNNLFPHLSVKKNIVFPLRFQTLSQTEQTEKFRRAVEATEVSHLLDKYPHQLSGGEQQRVALARTVATDSDIIFLDEPLSAIDAEGKETMVTLLKKIHGFGKTIVHITHNVEETFKLANHLVIVNNGRILQQGSPEEILRYPKNSFVAQMFGFYNFFDTLSPTETETISKLGIPINRLPLVIHPSLLELSTEQGGTSVYCPVTEVTRTINGYYVKVNTQPVLTVFVDLSHPLSDTIKIGNNYFLHLKNPYF